MKWVEAQLSAIWDFYPTVQHNAEPLVDTIYYCMLLHIQNLLIWQCFLLYIDLEQWNGVGLPKRGLLPLPIAGQPGIFRLIPSLARKTHHSTVSWRQVGWHPAMNTRACFCSNIEKTRHILDWTRTSISELSVRHSAIELHAQDGHNLDCS